MGLGSKFKSCEDYDYVLQYMNNGAKVYFTNQLYVLHPDSNVLDNNIILKKIENNAIGHGALFKKHYSIIYKTIIYHLITPLVGVFLGFITFNGFKQKQYFLLLKYRLLGLLTYKKK